ncbi:glycosyl hydrolase family 18 protein [Candidatus Haliotispira prima]|uniref:Glycosyl hydrolase family 18 protein n=1 Tax=Candidatus Haliotispira prima TaxID=3034016 RepID=A0ABY8MGP6_9SPIO|nr:glycosyl hydrolase family 18 protein [Candidatus Haliotispira prima]
MLVKKQLWLRAIMLGLFLVLLSCDVAVDKAATGKNSLSKGSVWNGKQTPRTPQSTSKAITIGYYPSWTLGWVPASGETTLSKLPGYVTHVIFSFAKANMRYTKGSYDISRTGIQSDSSAGNRLAHSIELLRAKGTKVVLSLGGEAYWRVPANYTDIHYDEIKDLVDDYGFDGIDWDYEPQSGFALMSDPTYRNYLITYIRESRKVMPKSENYLIMTAPPGVGALGGSVSDDINSDFPYSSRGTYGGINAQGGSSTEASGLFNFGSTGTMIPVLQADGSVPGKKIGHDLDLVAYQSYNTGAALLSDPVGNGRMIMYRAWLYYAKQYGFALAHGTHVPPEPWKNLYVHTPQEMGKMSKYVADRNASDGRADGIMIWQLLMKHPQGVHNGISYLKIASDILGGADPNTYDYGPVKTETNSNPDSKVPETGTPGSEKITSSYTPTDKSLRPYDAEAVYNEGGYLVSYQGSIYENSWWSQGDTPGESLTVDGSPSPWVKKVDVTANPEVSGDSPSLRAELLEAEKRKLEEEIEAAKRREDGSYSAWSSTTVYSTFGTIVLYEGAYYRLQYWSKDEQPNNPDSLTDYAWLSLGATLSDDDIVATGKMVLLSEISNPNLDKIRERAKAAALAAVPITVKFSKDADDPGEWVATVPYDGEGYFVLYSGKLYKSRWYADIGDIPGANAWGSWIEVETGGDLALRPGADNKKAWSATVVYPGADYYVTYEGVTYKSRWYANEGEIPSATSSVWEVVASE